MTLTRIAAPAAEPVTLSEAKAHLRVSDTGEDTLISGLLKAAREEVEQATGLALIGQDWRLYLDCWPPSGVVRLRRHPVQSVIQVTVYDGGGNPQTSVPPSANLDKASRPARFLMPDSAKAPGRALNGVEIDFRAGFGNTGVEVPDGLKRAILLLTAYWYEHRGAQGGTGMASAWPDGFERIIARYRHMEL
ncbi:MAG: head-tail connector protein [Rhizobiaceae bacterium]